MDNNDVIKKALAEAATKGNLSSNVLNSEEFQSKNKTPAKLTPTTPKQEKKEEPEKVRTEPIWPVGKPIDEWKKDLAAERTESEKKRAEFLKYIDSPEHLAEVRKSAIEAVARLPARHIPHSERVAEKKEPKVKVKPEKKEGRQNRLGQTKLIDDLLKTGKTEKEIFDIVREKIPQYPADKLPKLIKLRQYHVKK